MKACFTILLLSIFYLTSASQRDDGINGLEVKSVDNLSWETYDCFAQNGYKLVILKASGATGQLALGAPLGFYAAQTNNMEINLYIDPCYKCGNPRDQVDNIYKQMFNHFLDPHEQACTWVHVTGMNNEWDEDPIKNIAFIGEMLDEIEKKGYKTGIYTGDYDWEIVTSNTDQLSKYSLWYGAGSNVENFEDFPGFGGWTTPTMKQYSYGGCSECIPNVCGVIVLPSWKPA